MHRRTFLAAALALAAAGTATAAGCTTGTATTPTTSGTPTTAAATRAVIGLSYIPNVQFAPFYVAEQQSLFGEVPATVSLRHHGATEGLFTALTAGTEDFLVAAGSEAMQARAEGVDVIAVGAYYKAFPAEVIVLGTSPIKDLAGLKGRSLGVPGRYGESWLAAQLALATAGLTEDDVTITGVGYTQVAALTTKKVDAIIGFKNNELVQLDQAGTAARAIPVAAGTVPLVSASLLTTKAYADAHPDVVRAVVAATARAIEATAADPEAAVDTAATQIPGWTEASRANATAVLAATLEVMGLFEGGFDPALDADQWAAMASFLEQHKLITKPVTAADAFSNDYAS